MKGLQVTKKVRSYEKGTERLQRGYEISYKRPWLRSYQVKRYEVTKKVRKGYERPWL
jgi:hypothetical protein